MTMTIEASNQATRIAELRRKSGLSLHQVAEKLNKLLPEGSRSHATIQRYEKDDSIRIKKPVLVALAKVYRTTPEFIETGSTAKLQLESTAEILGTKEDLDYVKLPFIQPAAYGTFGANCQDYQPGDYDTMRVLKRPGQDYNAAVVIEVRGNSMAPRYPDRSCYVVRPVSSGNWQYATGVHCVSLRSEMFVIKRITKNTDGVLTLTSDNGGDEITIQLGDILCMWKVGEAAYMPAED
ncbi:MAG: LexA family transcriptional regulator [Janthinobacterium lividum]